jgi:hypothetical protein
MDQYPYLVYATPGQIKELLQCLIGYANKGTGGIIRIILRGRVGLKQFLASHSVSLKPIVSMMHYRCSQSGIKYQDRLPQMKAGEIAGLEKYFNSISFPKTWLHRLLVLYYLIWIEEEKWPEPCIETLTDPQIVATMIKVRL